MHVVLIAAQSLDGYITRHEEPGTAFTSPEDKQHFSRALRDFDCRVMGSTTYKSLRESVQKMARAGNSHLILTRKPNGYAAEAIPGALQFTSDTPREVVDSLAREGHKRCALLGGGLMHALFLRAQLVNELWITIEPRLFGSGTHLAQQPLDVGLRLKSHENLSADTLLLKYDVITA